MADIIATALAWQASQLQAHANRTVTYQRGNASASMDASIGRKLLQVTDAASGDIKMVHADRDYLIAASEMVLSGNPIKPKRGDRIIDDGEIYEVFPPADGEPEWRPGDGYGVVRMIHTKFVGTEEE